MYFFKIFYIKNSKKIVKESLKNGINVANYKDLVLNTPAAITVGPLALRPFKRAPTSRLPTRAPGPIYKKTDF